MTEFLKILGQATPTAGVLTDFYTTPALTSSAISSIIICNQNTTGQIAFRVAMAINGAANISKQYLYYDVPLMANDTFIATIGISLATNDVIRIQTDTANVSFMLFGLEVM